MNDPTAEQQRWRELIRREGSVLTRYRPCQIHHPIGRSAKVKIDGVSTNIGHWYVLPLAHDEHRWVDEGNRGLDRMKENYGLWHRMTDEIEAMSLHEFEKFLFGKMCRIFKLPFEDDIYQAIMAWHR